MDRMTNPNPAPLRCEHEHVERQTDPEHGEFWLCADCGCAQFVLVTADYKDASALREELEDWRSSAKRAAGDECGDEKHCTCVGVLRASLAAMERERDELAGDDSIGDVIHAHGDGTIVLDDGITTHSYRRAAEFLAKELDAARADSRANQDVHRSPDSRRGGRA
jgi:hypothetical protein